MAAYPCTDDPREIIESITGAGADAAKLSKFVNGTYLETVQLGSGGPTPTIRRLVEEVRDNVAASVVIQTDVRLLNALDFGAVDARDAVSTDAVLSENAEAVQAAVNSAVTNGGTVYVPQGVKYLRSQLDDRGVLVVDDSTGTRITSRDYWWRPGVPSGGIFKAAHRGLSAVYPENTVLAFSAAGELGFGAIETDIQWTSDGYPVCIHDATVDRTTDGTGDVADMTLDEIRALDAGSFVDSAFSACKVPTFEEYLSVCHMYGAAPFIEIKTADNVTDARLLSLIETVGSFGLLNTAVFMAFDWTYLAAVRFLSGAPGVCALQSGAYSADNLHYMEWLGGRVYWGPDHTHATGALVSEAMAAGVATYAWTVGGAELRDAKAAGCASAGMNNWIV